MPSSPLVRFQHLTKVFSTSGSDQSFLHKWQQKGFLETSPAVELRIFDFKACTFPLSFSTISRPELEHRLQYNKAEATDICRSAWWICQDLIQSREQQGFPSSQAFLLNAIPLRDQQAAVN